jgi:hypothetical protein
MPAAGTRAGQQATTSDYGTWEPFLGKDPHTPALPDWNSNYFAYSFDRRNPNDNAFVGLRVTGDYGYARYMSLNIYEAEYGDTFGDVYGSLTDFQINPSPGNVNPFRPGVDPNAEDRKYVVTIVPNGYATGNEENLLTYDSAEINILSVIMRYYVPVGGDDTAGMPMPTIEAFDIRNPTVTLPLPELYSIADIPTAVFADAMHPIFATMVDNTLRFYHAPAPGLFPNADNRYLICGVKFEGKEVLLVRFRPPTFALENDDFGKTEVRYWSINQGSTITSTPYGMRDVEFNVSSDGYVYVAIGHERLREEAEGRGYNFMPWQVKRKKGILLYRNLVSDATYPGNINQVPLYCPDDPRTIYTRDAKYWIGEYAPTGEKVTETKFLRGDVDIIPPAVR